MSLSDNLFAYTYPDPKVPLNNQCDPDDVCLDQHGACTDNGLCECKETHFEKNQQCGEYSSGGKNTCIWFVTLKYYERCSFL